MSAFDAIRERYAVLAEYEGARDKVLLDLLDVRVTVDGPTTPAITDVAEQLRAMIAAIEPAPVPVLVPRGNRRQRRAAARARRRA